jgi:Uma2 family endonuclease
MSAAPQIFRATARTLKRDEYDRIAQLGLFRDERVELIRGMVVRMPPIGPPHSEYVDRLAEAFMGRLVGRARVRIQQPFLAADESEPEPDVAVVPAGSYRDRHPDRALLVVEVAESSLEYDRETKAPLYAESDVPEYWIVDVAAQRIEIHSEPANGAYARKRIAESGETIAPAAFPDVTVSVDALFA